MHLSSKSFSILTNHGSLILLSSCHLQLHSRSCICDWCCSSDLRNCSLLLEIECSSYATINNVVYRWINIDHLLSGCTERCTLIQFTICGSVVTNTEIKLECNIIIQFQLSNLFN